MKIVRPDFRLEAQTREPIVGGAFFGAVGFNAGGIAQRRPEIGLPGGEPAKVHGRGLLRNITWTRTAYCSSARLSEAPESKAEREEGTATGPSSSYRGPGRNRSAAACKIRIRRHGLFDQRGQGRIVIQLSTNPAAIRRPRDWPRQRDSTHAMRRAPHIRAADRTVPDRQSETDRRRPSESTSRQARNPAADGRERHAVMSRLVRVSAKPLIVTLTWPIVFSAVPVVVRRSGFCIDRDHNRAPASRCAPCRLPTTRRSGC